MVTMGRTIVVLQGAVAPFRSEEGDMVICADSGYASARAMGLKPSILVGDMDSISRTDLEGSVADGVDVRPYPADKDSTDGELALDIALKMTKGPIILLGGSDGRADHVLSAYMLLLLVPKDVPSELRSGLFRTVLLRGPQKKSFPSDLPVVSLVPLTSVKGVRTEGLKWHLEDEGLEPGSTRGIHNEPVSSRFSVSLEEGSLLLMRGPLEV
jgi:thiamine pyrophosphokinase